MNEFNSDSISKIFTEGRSHHSWLPKKVDDSLLYKIYDIGKWGPTSLNANPARLVFLKSNTAKEKLIPALMGSNIEQVKTAPITVIVAHDEKFYENLLKLFPAFDARAMFSSNKELSDVTAFRNSSLQGAYFLLAARTLGLDVCPMSGFDNSKADDIFFAGTSWKSNFIFTLGYGDTEKLHPRGPRLSFEEACLIE